ncbi:uncharacterized protein V1516DRAFT_665652 [Lipomyces oligophaga]|uniref:uncharacterized protein n=1 Tax=Lipomyces oligophaga TaxID=45792 RepID=UPI0034CE4E0E
MTTAEIDELWCSACSTYRPAQDFGTFPSGKARKLCGRHEKRPTQQEYDNWADFENELAQRSRLTQKAVINLRKVFDLDSLPANISARFTIGEDGYVDRSNFNAGIRDLAAMIWRDSGFRFFHKGTNWSALMFTYYCCQDDKHAPPSTAQKRGVTRMRRFDCRSLLTFSISARRKTLTVIFRHNYHEPYEDRRLSQEVLDFIQDRLAIRTSIEIFKEMQDLKPTGWESVTRQQVYYYYQQASSKLWRLDQNSFTGPSSTSS